MTLITGHVPPTKVSFTLMRLRTQRLRVLSLEGAFYSHLFELKFTLDLRTYTNKACVYERLDDALNFVNWPRFNMIGTWDDLYDHLRRMRTFTRYLYNFHKRLQSWFGLLIISLNKSGCIVSFSAHLPYVRNKFAKTKTRSTCRAHDTYWGEGDQFMFLD